MFWRLQAKEILRALIVWTDIQTFKSRMQLGRLSRMTSDFGTVEDIDMKQA